MIEKPKPAQSRSRRRVRVRPPLSMAVLALGILLLLGAAWQAFGAARAQERTVTRVLQSYAAVAAWNFEQQANTMLRDAVEAVFHRTLHGMCMSGGCSPLRDREEYRVSPAALVTERTDLAGHHMELIAATRYAARFALGDDAVVTTAAVDDAETGALQGELRAHYRRTPRRDWITAHELIHAYEIGDSAAVVIYSPGIVSNDTVMYALVMSAARLAPMFERILAAGSLLPEPLVNGVPLAELLSLGLMLPASGRMIYGTAPLTDRTDRRPLPKLGGMLVGAELLPGAEAHLILGESPAGRARFVLGMLAVAIGLMVIAFSQIRREHALARMRADFVSSVSHELRTPLALQRVFLDMLRLGRVTTDEKRRWCFDNIDRESLRLAHLVENVLHFSRAQQGTMRVRLERAPLAPMLAEIIRTFEPLAASAGTHVRARLDESISAPVDPGALRQVLTNLLENAVKYGAPGGSVIVSLELDGGIARVIVDDDGAGVPPQEREIIFEPHRRGTATINTAVAGSGIGLAVVRELVSGHGGRVYAGESPAGGARFVVELPDAGRDAARMASLDTGSGAPAAADRALVG